MGVSWLYISLKNQHTGLARLMCIPCTQAPTNQSWSWEQSLCMCTACRHTGAGSICSEHTQVESRDSTPVLVSCISTNDISQKRWLTETTPQRDLCWSTNPLVVLHVHTSHRASWTCERTTRFPEAVMRLHCPAELHLLPMRSRSKIMQNIQGRNSA